jgi:hypothetical protein
MGFLASSAGSAHALTADDVMNKMTAQERSSYFAGVVEGLAQARWVADKPNTDGMQCIQNWYYGGGESNLRKIHTFFERHAEKPAAALLYVMIKQECGD